MISGGNVKDRGEELVVAALGVVLVAALVLTMPGLVVGAALGLRSWTLLGSAPDLTFGATGLLVTVTSAVGIPWTPMPRTLDMVL